MKRTLQVCVRCLVVGAATMAFLLSLPGDAAAQNPCPGKVSQELHCLFEVDFLRGLGITNADPSALLAAMIEPQVGTLPSTGAGGFRTWNDPAHGGNPTRKSTMFGPTVADRPLTIGAKQVSIAYSNQTVNFSTLGGIEMQGSSSGGQVPLTVYQANNAAGGNVYSRGMAMSMYSSSDTFLVTVGASDKFDIGVGIPIVNVSLSVHKSLTTLSSTGVSIHGVPTRPPTQANGDFQDSRTFVFSDIGNSARGLGDITLRGKYALSDHFGVGADLSLPTGDKDSLLGSGKAAFTVTGMAVQRLLGRWTPYGNAGFTGGGLANSFNYIGGVNIAVANALSVSTDIAGRKMFGLGDFTLAPHAVSQPTYTSIIVPTEGASGLSTAVWSAGTKVKVKSNILITGTAIVALTDGGLRAKFSALIGMEYAFKSAKPTK